MANPSWTVALILSAALVACSGKAVDTDTEIPVETDDTEVAVDVPYAEVQAIFDTTCATSGCHDGTFVPDLTAMGSPASIVGITGSQARMEHVAAGDPDNSYLLHKVNNTHVAAGGGGAQMPSTGCCLSDAEVQTLTDWIYQGASAQ
jgi:hypothetical protein